MGARAGDATLPDFLLRVFTVPAALAALIAAAAALVRRRTRQPSMPRMSDDWLRSHDVDYRRDLPW
jgi:hypothetical protein